MSTCEAPWITRLMNTRTLYEKNHKLVWLDWGEHNISAKIFLLMAILFIMGVAANPQTRMKIMSRKLIKSSDGLLSYNCITNPCQCVFTYVIHCRFLYSSRALLPSNLSLTTSWATLLLLFWFARLYTFMGTSDSDSDSDVESMQENPLELIRPDILAQMRHLDLSSYILFKERNFVSGGGYGDIFKGRCKFPERGRTKVAIKRLRFYLKEEIKTACSTSFIRCFQLW